MALRKTDAMGQLNLLRGQSAQLRKEDYELLVGAGPQIQKLKKLRPQVARLSRLEKIGAGFRRMVQRLKAAKQALDAERTKKDAMHKSRKSIAEAKINDAIVKLDAMKRSAEEYQRRIDAAKAQYDMMDTLHEREMIQFDKRDDALEKRIVVNDEKARRLEALGPRTALVREEYGNVQNSLKQTKQQHSIKQRLRRATDRQASATYKRVRRIEHAGSKAAVLAGIYKDRKNKVPMRLFKRISRQQRLFGGPASPMQTTTMVEGGRTRRAKLILKT